ncbi:MAG: HlyD family secretion protein, partial [Bradyrhizobium sp.]|nr:HlyD family secretion protein [Bradyrhizobium sp.]
RIYFDKTDKFVTRLKAGMSVNVSIDTGHQRTLAGLFGAAHAAEKEE